MSKRKRKATVVDAQPERHITLVRFYPDNSVDAWEDLGERGERQAVDLHGQDVNMWPVIEPLLAKGAKVFEHVNGGDVLGMSEWRKERLGQSMVGS
mgnify:FL=1